MVTKLVDIIFYKLYQAYKKKNDLPIYSSILFMGLIRFSILLFLGVSLDLFLNIRLPFKDKWETLIIVSFIELPFLIWTIYRYTKKEKIKELQNEFSVEKYDKIRPWYIFMLPVFFILLMLIVVFIFGNVVFLPGK